MTDRHLWTILVPTLGQREDLFLRLMNRLLPQLDEFAGAARVVAWRNNGQPPLGLVRDAMVRDADSEYVAFIDDDDLVPEYYVAEVMAALASRPDHVGFKVDYTTNGVGHEVIEHSLKWGRWHRNADGVLVRDFTHIDPVRRDVAMTGSFVVMRQGRAEDRVWVRQVRMHGRLRSEVYIDKIMYYYIWDESISAWQRPAFIRPKVGRPQIDHPHFAWHERSDP